MTSAELIAELVRKHVEGVPLAIDHQLGRRRAIAELYQTDRGFVFADIGWSTNDSGHPFHAVEGEAVAGDDGHVVVIHGEDHLQGRRSIVYEVRPDLRSEDPAARDAARWRDWLGVGRRQGVRRPGAGPATCAEPGAFGALTFHPPAGECRVRKVPETGEKAFQKTIAKRNAISPSGVPRSPHNRR